jgi:hypothetical protein
MNCFAHAHRFLERDPYFVVGTCVPDWLAMVDRKTRARQRLAAPLAVSGRGSLGQLAAGIVRHHQDDHWFHESREFTELNLRFAVELRERLGADAGFRPHLAGHILIEMLLDGYLTELDRSRLDCLYQKVATVSPARVQTGVNQIAVIPTFRLTRFLPRFLRERYLYDYIDNARTLYRLNRVLQGVRLAALPPSILHWLPGARERVFAWAAVMLTPPVHGRDNTAGHPDIVGEGTR